MTPQDKVIHYLKHDRTLMGGRNLYNQLPTKDKALQMAIGRFIDTPASIEKLCYYLAKAVGMEERILKMHTQNPIVAIDKIEVKDDDVLDTATPEDLLIAFNAETTDYNAAKALIIALGIKTADKKKETVFTALKEARAALIATKLQELPQEVKESIKIREQFPFLREPGCPDILIILINHLITAYEVFKENQPKLHDLMDDEARKALAATVKDNYIANKEAWAELEHYQKTKTILGKHPLFERMALKDAISALDTAKLTKKIGALKVNVSRNKDKPELLERDEDLLKHALDVLNKR